jgi:Transposase DDE domain group 1
MVSNVRSQDLGQVSGRDRADGELPRGAKPTFHRHVRTANSARGEALNLIKAAQLALFERRASCPRFSGNQLCSLLAVLANTWMVHLRRQTLKGIEMAHTCTGTIRTRLFKVGRRYGARRGERCWLPTSQTPMTTRSSERLTTVACE